MMQIQWFGESWAAPLCHDQPQAPTPVGQSCGHCAEPIADGDNGMLQPLIGAPGNVAYHYECFVRGLIGGIYHQQGQCFCCGGDKPPDPAGLSRRKAALLAVIYFEVTNQVEILHK